MPDFKDLTDFLTYLKIVRKATSSDCPRFVLSFSSKLQGSFLINQLLGFPLFPEKFSHKLASIELVLRASFDTLSTKNPTFELDGINEKFHCLEEFRTRFVHHILSFPQQDYTESVTVSVSMVSIPSFNLIILPDIQSEKSDELEYESTKKKVVKKALRDPNNLIICVSDIQDDLNISQPVEYLRQYDPYGSRTLLAFIDSGMSNIQDESQKLALQKILTEQEFPIKYGFVLFNKLPFQNQFNIEQREDQVECKTLSNEYEGNKTNEITLKEKESLFLAMKEMTLYSVRGIFPGLLDELKDIQRDLQARLDWLNEDGTQRGYNIKIEGIKPALDIGLQLRKEFQDEACSTVNYVTKERTTTIRKTSTNEPEVNKAISRIKAETDSDYVRSIDSLESQGDEIIVLMETVPFGFRINEIFANLYKSEANKDDIARFTILADDEIKNVFQTSQSRTVNDFVKSQGFKALVTSRLNWIIGCTCESVWNIHEAVSSTLVKQIEKYYIKLPILRDALKHELKGFIQETRETTVKALMPVLNSHINYVYCKDPVKVFGDLYEVPSAKGKRKNSFKPETSLVILIQQLSEASRLYCQSIIDTLGEIVPRMVGQLYLSEILQNIGRKMEACIDNLATENPEALKSIDPYQTERDVLEQKLMMTEKAKKFILHEPGLKQVVWIEGLNSEKITPEIPERPSETETSATTCDNTDVSKMNRKQWINDDLQVKRLNSDIVGSQSDIFKGPTVSYSVDEERINEDEYEVMKGMVENLDLNKIDSTSNLPGNKPKMRKESIQEDFKTQDDNQRTDTEGDEVQRSIQDDRKTSSMPILSDTNNVGCNLNGKPSNYQDICFEGVEIIEDYWSRLQKHQEKVFRKKDWLIQIESRSLVDIDSSRLFPSLYYGINTDIRGSVWKVIANVKELRARHPKGYYEELSSTPSENWDYVIAKDVPRTLIDEPFFKNSQYQGDVKLKQILRAYAHYDPDLGYTQGMNALAGIILMVMCGYKSNTNPAKYKRVSKSCERNAFWILVYLMREKGYRDSFLDSYPRLMENLKSFEKVMMRKTPWALQHLTKSGVSVESAFMHQFLTAGGQHAPLELFLRIMDIFMVKGEAVLFELILKALDLCKKEILSVKDEKLFKFLKHDILYLALKKCGGDVNKLLSYVDEV